MKHHRVLVGFKGLPSGCGSLWLSCGSARKSGMLFVVDHGHRLVVILATEDGLANVLRFMPAQHPDQWEPNTYTLLFVLPASAPFIYVSGMKQGWAFPVALPDVRRAAFHLTGLGLDHLTSENSIPWSRSWASCSLLFS